MPADAAKISLDPVIFCTVMARFGKGWIQKRATRGAKASRKLRRLCRGCISGRLFHRNGLGLSNEHLRWPCCIAPGVIATGRIMATVIPGSSQSNLDRAELVALRRLGTVEDCAKVVEFLATDLSEYVTGTVIPIDGGLVRG
jgi:Enoyl-(Acyl carrier protein) reductase